MTLHEVAAEHDHARDPEKQNLVRSDQQRRGIENFLISCLLRPAQGGKRQQPGRKPRIEDVSILLQVQLAAFRALCGSLARDNNFSTLTVPRRNAMTPPQLPRNAP